MKRTLIFFALIASSLRADDLSLTFHLEEGNYYTSGKSTLVAHHLRLRRWGNDVVGEGSYLFGERSLPFKVTFHRSEKNIFDGKGDVEVMTEGREMCRYPTRITIYAYQEKIFVKDFSPVRYADSLGTDGKCAPAAPAAWVVHDEPYYRFPNE